MKLTATAGTIYFDAAIIFSRRISFDVRIYESRNYFHLLRNTAMNLRFSQNASHFLAR